MQAKTSWTVMVYISAEGYSENLGVQVLKRLKTAAHPTLNVVAEITTGPMSHSKRYAFGEPNDRFGTINHNVITMIGPNANDGSANLESFLEWAAQHYPADHYFLIIWGHGSGKSVSSGIHVGADYRHELRDFRNDSFQTEFSDSPKDYLSSRLGRVMRNITQKMGQKLDLLGMDVCNLSLFEFGYEICNDVDYLIASQAHIPGASWPYERIISELAAQPYTSPQGLAQLVVQAYALWYQDYVGVDGVLSALNLSILQSSIAPMRECVAAMLRCVDDLACREEIKDARSKVQAFGGNRYIDLITLCKLLASFSNSNVAQKAFRLLVEAGPVVVANQSSSFGKFSNGISIYFPLSVEDEVDFYKTIPFAKETGWGEFIQRFLERASFDRRVEESAFDAKVDPIAVTARVDQYLFHCLEAVNEEKTLEFAKGTLELAESPQIRLPMLVRVKDAAQVISDVEDCRITSCLGNIIACIGTIKTIEALRKDSRIMSIEASRPGSGVDCAVSVPFIRADQVHSDAQFPEKGNEALVAVIDGGIDVLHRAFRDKQNKSRIVGIWDQRDSSGPPPSVNGRALYGTLHNAADIQQYVAAGRVPAFLDRDPIGHGTHVTSIAAGQAAGSFFGGVAPEANILVVISGLKVNESDPFSIGYSNSHVDALSFIAAEAKRLQLPVVVNVSQGMNAGAHDGTSNLEVAFDNFSGGGREPGRIIVKSAGNERGFAGHALVRVQTGVEEILTWDSIAAHQGPDVIELWFRGSSDLRFQLIDPSKEVSPWLERDQSKSGFFQSGTKYSFSYEGLHWDNGDSRVLVTISRGQHLSIGVGEWRLKIEARAVQSDGIIHAWLERDESRPIKFTNHNWEDYTLSIPGTARTVIAVGSVAACKPVKVATYSSYGPTRDGREKPDLVAPGELIKAAQSGTSDDTIPMSGTSMAAPHVAGAIALLLSRQEKRMKVNLGGHLKQYNAAQIQKALAMTTQNYNGHSTPSTGYGILDVRRFLEIFP